MNRKLPFILILAVSIGGSLVTGQKLFTAVREYKAGEDIYEEIAEIARNPTPAISAEITNPEISEITPESEPDEKSRTAEINRSPVDFARLAEISPDIRGWIRLEGTRVDYPVMQSRDNDYYLSRAVNGTWNKVGTPFIDFRNNGDFSDRLTVIYGHYMGDGSMFASLDRWQQEAYLAEHPVMYLNTPSCNYRVDIIAGFTTPADSDAYRYEFSSIMDIQNWISWIREMSVIHPDIELSPVDRFLTLSTCAYSYEDARTVLIGRNRSYCDL